VFSCEPGPGSYQQGASWIVAAGDTFKLYQAASCDPAEVTGKIPDETLVVSGTPPAALAATLRV
jgi:uncharacterized membrane protein